MTTTILLLTILLVTILLIFFDAFSFDKNDDGNHVGVPTGTELTAENVRPNLPFVEMLTNEVEYEQGANVETAVQNVDDMLTEGTHFNFLIFLYINSIKFNRRSMQYVAHVKYTR